MSGMMSRSVIACFAVAVATCGLARANTQEVMIEAVDERGAMLADAVCDIANRNGTWRVVTPARAHIIPAGDWLQVKCARGFELAGTLTSIDTTQSGTRRSAGAARELSGNPAPAKVRVVLRDTTGALQGQPPTTQTQVAQAASLPSFLARTPVLTEPAATSVAPSCAATLASAADQPAATMAPAPEAAPPLVAAVAAPVADVLPMVAAPTRTIDLFDVNAVPYLPESGRAAYVSFLNYPLPRAFAISKGGGWGWAVRGNDARNMALDNCERRGGPCEIYAVDRQVVWAGAH